MLSLNQQGGHLTLKLQRQLRQMRGISKQLPVMRGLYAAIVDEADSVLIDEANTPLIISGRDRNEMLLEAIPVACRLADRFQRGIHYQLDSDRLDICFTDDGLELLASIASELPPFWCHQQRCEQLISQALLARDIFKKDRHYVVVDEKITIVDENTGRRMPNRSWSLGLHQAIEARERIPLTQPSRVLRRKSFQSFFRRYHKLCGASGTLQGISKELWSTYGLLNVKIKSRLPSCLQVTAPVHYKTREEKIMDLCEYAGRLRAQGLPVLIGTRRISDSELIAGHLQDRNISCAVLNAKQDQYEAEVIAKAGESRAVTVATNMAGRGVDIKVSKSVSAAGGLQVLMFEPHESRRVDWQLFGRSGRQGAKGRATMYVSSEDDLLIRYLPWFARWLLCLGSSSWLGGKALRFAVTISQWRAQRFLASQRRLLVKRDKLLDDQLTFSSEKAMNEK